MRDGNSTWVASYVPCHWSTSLSWLPLFRALSVCRRYCYRVLKVPFLTQNIRLRYDDIVDSPPSSYTLMQLVIRVCDTPPFTVSIVCGTLTLLALQTNPQMNLGYDIAFYLEMLLTR